MKVSIRCAECLFSRGIKQASLATPDENIQFQITRELCKLFKEKFTPDQIPAVLGTYRDRIIARISGNPDPYANEKKISNEIALKFEPIIQRELEELPAGIERFQRAVLVSIVGNNMEFNIADHEITIENLEEKLNASLKRAREDLVIDDIQKIHEFIKPEMKILYLTDNAGEIVFDKFLIKELLAMGARVTVAVKGKPALNDATMEDAKTAGLLDMMQEQDHLSVITTETDHVGVILDEMSPSFQEHFYNSELMIAKGMGYYETLSDEKLPCPIVYLLRTKCKTVAEHLGVEHQKNVAFLKKFT
ncbi:MAG: damage-control phosphatase ARMT1 family protein [Candidatus Helarchaeales archaeon]